LVLKKLNITRLRRAYNRFKFYYILTALQFCTGQNIRGVYMRREYLFHHHNQRQQAMATEALGIRHDYNTELSATSCTFSPA